VDSLLDGFRTALIVPVAAAVLSAIVIASGLRARRDPKARARKFVPASD
jgi:preprotein translocase subunit SecF